MFEIPKRYYDKITGDQLTAAQALANTRIRLIPFDDTYKITEIMYCSMPKFNRGGYGLLGEVRRSVRLPDDVIPDDLKSEYISRSRRRAYKRVRDIMDANAFDWFVTLTFDDDVIDRTSYADTIKAINRWLDNNVRRHKWKYCGVVEYHKRTENNGKHAVHYHLCVSGDMRLTDSGTVIRPDGGKPVKLTTAMRQGYSRDTLKTVYNISDWRYGYSTAIHTYGERLQLSRYICKYILKSDDKIGGRWYYSGGLLDEPLYIKLDSDFDKAVGDVEFGSDFGDYKIRYFDKGVTFDRLDNYI
jgi:hypothetical protein